MSGVTIQVLEENHLWEVVHIHQKVLGYTLNSRLGEKHLSSLYGAICRDDASYVGVACVDEEVAGFVSGSLDLNAVKGRLLRSFTVRQWLNVAFYFLRHPLAMKDWQSGNEIEQPVYVDDQKVTAILSTIGVDERFQDRGLGRKLTSALEGFFSQHGVYIYRLDTRINNRSARAFYDSLGFTEQETRADSVIMVKRIVHD